MAVLDKVIAGQAKVFDALRNTSAFSTLELVKVDPATNGFISVGTVISGWNVEYSKMDRKLCTVQVATNNVLFTAQVKQATHLKIDDDVYAISSNDTFPPKTIDQPFWSLVCSRGFSRANIGKAY